MNQVVTEFRGRGIQQSDVFAAADALLAEGLRPTIERVRQKIGRGSPNTVSPMLERWFSTLSARMAGRAPGVSTAADEDDPVPAAVQSAAQLLWDTARREARAQEENAQASAREDLRAREEALAEGVAKLAQREAAFTQTRSSLDAALTAAQQAADALRQQLQDQAQEALRARADLESQILRLNAQLGQALDRHEAVRLAHDQALATKDQDLRRAEERHAQEHQRMLLEIDRSRQTIKSFETELAQEQARRIRGEDEGAQRLQEVQGRVQRQLDASRGLELELREQIAAQAAELAQARNEAATAQREADGLTDRLEEEKRSHDATRQLLTKALSIRAAPVDSKAKTPRRAPIDSSR